MTESRSNRHPEFLQETMFQEHGTKVLITNPQADQYLSDGDDIPERRAKDQINRNRSRWESE